MPIEFSTSLELDLVYTRWWGQVDLLMFRETFETYLTDKHYRPGRTELINFSDIEGLDADFKRIWAALNIVNNQAPGKKVRTRTIMISPGEVIYGLSRMYQTLAENADGITVEVYRSEKEALAALGLPYQTASELLEREAFLPYEPNDATGNGAA